VFLTRALHTKNLGFIGMARYECLIRAVVANIYLLPSATKALESNGFKVRSAYGDYVSLTESKSVQRLRDRVTVQIDQNQNPAGLIELQCVVSNEAIATSQTNPCRDTFELLVQIFSGMAGVEVNCPVLQ
jgi:hypothetical protein